MSEHSIEELTKQLRAAEDRARAANIAASEARERLKQARLDESGLKGHLVSYTKRTWKDPAGVEVRFVVDRIGRWSEEVAGPIVKKDGTLGERTASEQPKNLTDHGLYGAPGDTP